MIRDNIYDIILYEKRKFFNNINDCSFVYVFIFEEIILKC